MKNSVKATRTKEEITLYFERDNYSSEEERVYFKVITQAWNDAFYNGKCATKEREIARNNALKFFCHPEADYSDDLFLTKEDWYYSLETICEICDIDEENLVFWFKKWYDNIDEYKEFIHRLKEGRRQNSDKTQTTNDKEEKVVWIIKNRKIR